MPGFAAAAMRPPAGAVGAELRDAQYVGDLTSRDMRGRVAELRGFIQPGADGVDNLFTRIDHLVSDTGEMFVELLAFSFVHLSMLHRSRGAHAPEA